MKCATKLKNMSAAERKAVNFATNNSLRAVALALNILYDFGDKRLNKVMKKTFEIISDCCETYDYEYLPTALDVKLKDRGIEFAE